MKNEILYLIKINVIKKFLLFFIIFICFNFSLTGCSGCSYFYLKVESLDKNSKSTNDINNGNDAIVRINSVSSYTADGTYTVGQVVDIVITFSAPVQLVNGGSTSLQSPPTITLETGANDKIVQLVNLSDDGYTLSGVYTILKGDTSNDLNYVDITSLSTGSWSFTPKLNSNVSIDWTLPELNNQNSLAGLKNIIVDTVFDFSVTSATASILETDNDVTNMQFFIVQLKYSVDQDVVITAQGNSSLATSSDFELSTGTIIIPAGSTMGYFGLTIKGDVGLKEFDKEIEFIFSENILANTQKSIQVLLQDNDQMNLTVSPYYPVNGALWNSYVTTNSEVRLISPYLKVGPEAFPGDSPCGSSNYCIHAGEIRKVIVSWKSNCNNLTMTDDLDAFEWRCSDFFIPVFFYSVGLKKGKGLRHLIKPDGSGWTQNKVTLKDSNVIVSTSSLAGWWSNPILPLNSTNINDGINSSSRLTLSGANTIYAVTETVASLGIDFGNSNIGFVVLDSAMLSTAPAIIKDCSPALAGVQSCFIDFVQNDFNWIEGNIRGDVGYRILSNSDINLGSVGKFNRFHGLTLSNGSTGIYSLSNFGGSYDDILIANCNKGLESDYGDNNNFFNIKIYDSANRGIEIGNLNLSSFFYNIGIFNSANENLNIDSNFNSFDHILSVGGKGINIQIGSSSLQNTLIVNSATYGLWIKPGWGNSFYNSITVSNSQNYGINIQNSLNIHSNILLTNNSEGLFIDTILKNTPNLFSNIYSIDNRNSEIKFHNNSNSAKWTNNLYVGRASPACTYGTGTNLIGLQNSTCDPVAPSLNNTRLSNINANNIFQKFVTDNTNTHGAEGISGKTFASISDWIQFETLYRFWAPLDLGSLPNLNIVGPCKGSSPSCGILDLSLITEAFNLKNINGIFIANAPCPDSVKLSNMIHNDTSADGGFVFDALSASTEYLFDGVGNDNGACEPGEYCYFNPSAGANMDDPYLYTETCQYENTGAPSSYIKMYGRSN